MNATPATADHPTPPATVRAGWLVRVAWGVGHHPRLWPTALRSIVRLAAPGWWRRWPPVPTPPAAYVRFRSVTNSGNDDLPPVADVIRFLKWARGYRGVLG